MLFCIVILFFVNHKTAYELRISDCSSDVCSSDLSTREVATFAIHRRASEQPLYRIEKRPKLARRQGAFSVIAASGLVMKRGHDLAQVLKVFEKRNLRLIEA